MDTTVLHFHCHLCSRPLSITSFLHLYLSTKISLAANTHTHTLASKQLNKLKWREIIEPNNCKNREVFRCSFKHKFKLYHWNSASWLYCQIAILFLLAWKSCLSSQSCWFIMWQCTCPISWNWNHSRPATVSQSSFFSLLCCPWLKSK